MNVLYIYNDVCVFFPIDVWDITNALIFENSILESTTNF